MSIIVTSQSPLGRHPSGGEVPQLEGFDQFIQDAMASWHCPGVAVAVIKGDEILHQNAYGFLDVEVQLPMTVHTRFAMASVTKSVTAMSVALLVDDGKLEWDKPVKDYMPEFILDDPYATQHVTLRDMLSHRTGMPRHDFSAWRLDLSRAEFVRRMRHLKFSATFREKFQYNNLMYCAAAYLVEKIAEQRWEDFVQQRIFSPLGMDASNFVPESPQPGLMNAKGYRIDWDEEGCARELIHTPFGKHTEVSPGAAGALFSTLADLTHWLKAHVNGGQSGDVRLISANNLKQMHLPQTIIPGGGIHESLHGTTIATYGMGWFIVPYQGHTLIHHGGNVEGHSLAIGFIPQKNIGVIALTNVAGMPLRDVLLYEGMDRALNLPDRNWNTRYHNVWDPLIIAEAKCKNTSAAERLEEAAATHSLETYAGTYEADGYPDFTVKLVDGALAAWTVGSLAPSTLRHYHYNVFEWHLSDFDFWMKIHFVINDNGEIDSISIPIEPTVENVIFKRKAVELSEHHIAALVGEYEPPVEGLTITISAREGKVHYVQTGGIPKLITPYKVTEDVIGFRVERTRLEFMHENGKVTHLISKSPFSTLESPRKQSS